ncbi:MAG TPA: Ig-like domain repeat protein [Terriglobales bacterium]|nr:Ig-like domain repeat protein [Terriglobales bacterium]
MISRTTALIFVFYATAAWTQIITTMAGGGNPTGLATTVPIGQPWALVQDGAGNIYIADNHSNRVFKVDTSNNLTVVAGNSADGLEPSLTPVPATGTSLSFPQNLALDGNGGLYIADDGNNEIRVVNINAPGGATLTLFPSAATPIVVQPGEIANVAGMSGGSACFVAFNATCSDGNFATSAPLNAPAGVVLDSSGNIFIADTGDNGIREVDHLTGVISNVAGVYCNESCVGGGDGHAAALATFNAPTEISLDSAGNVYVADTNDQVIRVINRSASTLSLFGGSLTITSGDIQSVAGNFGVACQSAQAPCGDSSTSTSASTFLNLPNAVFVDSSSNIYIADTGDQVMRYVDASSGTITRLAGTYFTPCSPISPLSQCGDGGQATAADLNNPTGLMVSGNNLYIADELDAAIREVNGSTGKISTIAGIQFNKGLYGNGGPATSAEIQNPVGVAADSSGNVFIADTPANVIRKVNAQGTISTLAGTALSCQLSSLQYCGDNGPATLASLWLPSDVFADSAGNVYIADTLDNAIRKVNVQTGIISTVAGDHISFSAGSSGDGGPATSALLNGPSGVSVDSQGDIFIADTNNNRIREVTISNGLINTIAGNGTAGYSGDGASATSAELNHPAGVSVDAAGNIYIVDGSGSAGGNNVIRMVNTKGTISTVAGNFAEGPGYSGDGGTATQAQLSSPYAAFVDFLGNLFIADSQNAVIRVANLSTGMNTVGGVPIAAGNINTVVGQATIPGFSGDNGTALSAQLHQPLGMRSDLAGNLYIADRLNWRVRKVAAIVATPPTANVSSGSLTFASQTLHTVSAQQKVTITNNGNLSPLQFTIAFSGANPGDFQGSDNCSGIVISNGGTCTLDVTFTPGAAGARSANLTITDANAGIAQNISLSGTGGKSATTTTLQSSLNPAGVGQSVTFTATVSPATGGTPTGTVTFNDGTTALGGAVNLNGGAAVLAISTLKAATHTISAVYSGDSNYSGSTSAVLNQVVNTESFTVKAASFSPSTVTAGGSATSTITITSVDGFNSAVTLNCSVSASAQGTADLPTCTVTSPVTPAANKTVTSTLTVSTTAAQAALVRPVMLRRSASQLATWLFLPAMLLSTAGLGTTRRKQFRKLFVTLAALGVLFLAGCGGGSSSSGGNNNGGTPTGAYTVTITGTAAGVTSQSTTAVLNVQ